MLCHNLQSETCVHPRIVSLSDGGENVVVRRLFLFSESRSVLIFHCFSSLSGLVVSAVHTGSDTISEKLSDSGFAKPSIIYAKDTKIGRAHV